MQREKRRHLDTDKQENKHGGKQMEAKPTKLKKD